MAELVEARMFGDVDEYNRRAIHKATCGEGPGHGIFHRSVRRAGRDACGLRSLRLAFLALLRGSVLPKPRRQDRKSTRLNSSHITISYAVFCLKKKKKKKKENQQKHTQ